MTAFHQCRKAGRAQRGLGVQEAGLHPLRATGCEEWGAVWGEDGILKGRDRPDSGKGRLLRFGPLLMPGSRNLRFPL